MTDRRWIEPEERKQLTRKERVTVFLSTDGRCYVCGQKLGSEWHAEHPQALALMGKDDIAAQRPICIPCHKPKTALDRKSIAKAKNVRDKHIGARKAKKPFKGWRKFDGTPVWATEKVKS